MELAGAKKEGGIIVSQQFSSVPGVHEVGLTEVEFVEVEFVEVEFVEVELVATVEFSIGNAGSGSSQQRIFAEHPLEKYYYIFRQAYRKRQRQ